MPGNTPFHLLQLSDMPSVSPMVTDRAIPFSPVPIYFIHSLEKPFCKDSTCKCHYQAHQVQRLLGNIVEGEMSLREAADFIDTLNREEM